MLRSFRLANHRSIAEEQELLLMPSRQSEKPPRKPFRLSPASRSQPSVYVAEIVIDGVPYTYGFSVDDRKIPEGWLYSYPEKQRRILLSRNSGEIHFGSTLGEFKPKLEMLEEFTSRIHFF